MSVAKEASWSAELFRGRKLDEASCDKDTLKQFGIKVASIEEAQREVGALIAQKFHRYK
jgi:hypothetical protein